MRRFGGLPYPGDRITIAIDRRTGLCVHLESVWHRDLRGSPPAEDIGPEAALRVFRDQIGVELWYAPRYTRASPRHREPADWTLLWRPGQEGTLVRPADGVVLDAYGDPLAFPPAGGQAAADTRPVLPWDRATAGRWLRDALEIPTHWVELAPFPFPRAAGQQFRWGAHPVESEFVSAEVDLELGLVLRAQRQTTSAGPAVTPGSGRPATREDLLFMLASRGGKGPEGAPVYADVPAGSALAEAVGMAGAQGILRRSELGPNLDPAATVTRIELCRWTARLLRLAPLAAAGLAVKFPWSDGAGLPDEDRRAATFLHAMGLLPWTGRRLGTVPATLGEAAQVLFAADQRGAG